MKIKVRHMAYEDVMALPRSKHQKPKRPHILFRTLVRLASQIDLWQTSFSYTKDKDCDKNGPYLILMNHSSFIDLKLISKMLYPRPYCVVSTTDAMVGKGWLMRQIGCIPTQKFITDMTLIRDMKYALQEKKTNVLMFPEAGYSFDGRSTTLPRGLGGLVKLLGVPVLYVQTYGAFARDPLYNGLQNRKVKVSAHMSCLISTDDVKYLSAEVLEEKINNAFSFDNFAWQYENKIKITEKFRADGLERLLYKCPACGVEGKNTGKGIHLTCQACGKVYELTELGRMAAVKGETEYPHIPHWFDWERACVRKELEQGTYTLETDVDIACMIDDKALYMVGEGHLSHSVNGFRLTGCDGKLSFEQSPVASHSLNADYFWYEIGDVICIGNRQCLYYCFPKEKTPVAKARLATEELYKIKMKERRS